MNPEIFPGSGIWLRCQLHSHTTNSDGEATPDELIAHYAKSGFDVLAITDHWHATACEDQRLLVISSSELSARVPAAHGARATIAPEAEILALGVGEIPERREHFPTIEQAAAWIVAAGGVPFLAHPHWSGLDADDYLEAPSLAGIEIFNGGCELESGSGTADELWDAVRSRGRACLGIATDDCHQPGRDSNRGWTVVRAAARTREAVLEALRSGAFYASSGPRIDDLRLDGWELEVRCSPAVAVSLRSAPWDGARANADRSLMSWRGEALERDADDLIVRVRLRCPERAGWGRIEVLGADGSRAWTNPLQLPLAPAGTQSNWSD